MPLINPLRRPVRTPLERGFTLIELMLATAVFSVTLLIALNGFLQIGRLFYKGVSNTQTSGITRQLLNEFSRNLQITPDFTGKQTASSGSGQYYYYCLNGNRYTYTRGSDGRAIMLDLSKPKNYSAGDDANFGLVKDSLPGTSSCAAPCDPDNLSSCGSSSIPLDKDNLVELLGNNMRVGELTLEEDTASATQNLYNIKIMLISGSDESLDFPDGFDRPDTARCAGGLSNQQFCSISQLTTSTYKGLDP